MVQFFLNMGIRPRSFRESITATIHADKFKNFAFLLDEMIEIVEWGTWVPSLLYIAASREFEIKTPSVAYVRYLLCRGARIDEKALRNDSTYFLGPVSRAMRNINAHENMGIVHRLFSKAEKAAIREICLVFGRKKLNGTHRNFQTLISYISYHGMFMAPGFEQGSECDYADMYMFSEYYDSKTGELNAID